MHAVGSDRRDASRRLHPLGFVAVLVASVAEEAGGAVAMGAVVDSMNFLAPFSAVGDLAAVGLARRLEQRIEFIAEAAFATRALVLLAADGVRTVCVALPRIARKASRRAGRLTFFFATQLLGSTFLGADACRADQRRSVGNLTGLSVNRDLVEEDSEVAGCHLPNFVSSILMLVRFKCEGCSF